MKFKYQNLFIIIAVILITGNLFFLKSANAITHTAYKNTSCGFASVCGGNGQPWYGANWSANGCSNATLGNDLNGVSGVKYVQLSTPASYIHDMNSGSDTNTFVALTSLGDGWYTTYPDPFNGSITVFTSSITPRGGYFNYCVGDIINEGDTITWSDVAPPSPTSISFLFPTDGTTTSDFNAWHTSITVTTSTDMYEACVNSITSNGNFGSSCQNFIGATTTAQNIDIRNQYAWSNYNTTTTVTSTAYISDVTLGSGYLASSTPITFTVLPTASGNATGTYTPPLLATSSIFNATSGTGILMSTSTCSGWGDFGCALGNAFSNTINFLFGIDQNTIETIAGFQLANTQPWSFIPQIANDFQNQGQQTGSFATSTISFNLGNGSSTQVAFFSASTVHKFISDSAASLIRNIIYLMLIMEIGYIVYIEIKNIFGKPKA